MSLETLKRDLVALGMLQKVKKHEKGVVQTHYKKGRDRVEELAVNIAAIDKLISSTELEMSDPYCLNGVSQHVMEAKMQYLDSLWSLRRQNVESQQQLATNIKLLETQLLKLNAQQSLAADLGKTKRSLILENLVRLSEEK